MTDVCQGASPSVVALREAAPESIAETIAAAGAIVEAVEAEGEPRGTRFRVRVIQAGLSGNKGYYPDAALREGASLFDGARVLVKADAEHLAGRGRDPRAVIGRLVEAKFVAGSGPDKGSIEAVFEAIDPADPMIVKLREAVTRGMSDLFGLSIDARAAITREAGGVRRVSRFVEVKSVDLIVEPGAGGRVLDVIEAAPEVQDDNMPRDLLIALIREARPELLTGRDVAAMTNDELGSILTEALAPAEPTAGEALTRADLDAAVARVEAKTAALGRIGRATLPEPARARVACLVEAAGDYSEKAVDAAIEAEQAYLAPFVQEGRVRGAGADTFARIETGETRAEKTAAMFEAFFDPNHRDHAHARSFRDIYVAVTGDKRVTGLLRDCDQALMREALDSQSWDVVLGDGIHRRLIADYRSQTDLDMWKLLTGTPVPVADFRNQERARYGGYGDLPAVAEAADYLALTSPDDEGAKYAVTKRGGLETVTLEMIKNDDVGALARIPTRLSRAAKRTLAKFVLDFLRTNPAIYDTKSLFHADHGNLGAAALSDASFAAARLAMKAQAEPGSAEKLGVGPRYLWVPDVLEQTARDMFKRDTNLDETFVQSLKPTIVPVWYWTDANDWVATADVRDIPLIEIGFLDGDEEPTLLVQDSPTSGSMFAADKITYKIRHIYGGAVLDYRGAYKAVVA